LARRRGSDCRRGAALGAASGSACPCADFLGCGFLDWRRRRRSIDGLLHAFRESCKPFRPESSMPISSPVTDFIFRSTAPPRFASKLDAAFDLPHGLVPFFPRRVSMSPDRISESAGAAKAFASAGSISFTSPRAILRASDVAAYP